MGLFLAAAILVRISAKNKDLKPQTATPHASTMRDRRFVAEHRGGPLTKEQHCLLMQWAIACAEHVLPLFGETIDERLQSALRVAMAWKDGYASVGDARNAAVAAHATARQASTPAAVAVARAVGHAVATAHMADHSLGAALYALKAVKATDGVVEAEKKWQEEQLPLSIRELVLTAWETERFRRVLAKLVS